MTNCPEVNSKTKIGLTPKELIWILSLVVGIGFAYADIKNDMSDIHIKILELEQNQTNTEQRLQETKEIDSKNYQNILLELQAIRGDMKLKQDRYK